MKRLMGYVGLPAALALLTAGAAHGQEPLKIGMHAMLTGPLAEVGKDAQFGAQVAVALLNESGGGRGRKVELVLYDDQAKSAAPPEIAPAGKYVLANSLYGPVQGRAGARIVAVQLKAKRIAVLVVDNDFGRTLAKAFRPEAEALGATIVAGEGA